MIEFKTYDKNELYTLVHSDEFRTFSTAPVSFHRALSQIKNPRLHDEDTLLIIAFVEDKMAGYIGILPDILFSGEAKFHFGWLSTLYVNTKFRGQKIGQKLLLKACSEYGDKIMITEFTPEAEKLYIKTGLFQYENSLSGTAYYFFLNLQKILPQKNEKFNAATPLLKITDTLANIFLRLSYGFLLQKTQSYHPSEKLDTDIKHFITNNPAVGCFKKNIDEIIWMAENPWIMKSDTPSNYQFSSFDKQFRYVFLKILKNGIITNVLVLSVRNSFAKLLYVFGSDNFKNCAQVLQEYSVRNKINTLLIYHPDLNVHFRTQFSLFKKERIRKYLIHKNFKGELGTAFVFKPHSSDGDTVFT